MKLKLEIDLDVLGDTKEGRDALIVAMQEAAAAVNNATAGGLWPGIGDKLFDAKGNYCGFWRIGE